MIQRTILLGIRDCFVFFLFLAVFLLVSPSVLASPKTGWIDLHAQVPEGFKGSVSVVLEHQQSSETQIITCYTLNDYANSVQIPLGEYTVMSAFTSEDSFIYEASTKTEQFILMDEIKIEVTVTHNPEGDGILANLNQEPVEITETTENPETAGNASDKTKELAESTDSDTDPEQNKEITKTEENESPDEEDEEDRKTDAIAKATRNILLTIAATLSFLIGTVLLVVYIQSKFGSG